MEYKIRHIVGFILSIAMCGWMTALVCIMFKREWQFSVIGMLCMAGIFFFCLKTALKNGREIYRVWEYNMLERLKRKYQKKYLPHADDEIYLYKKYVNVTALEGFLATFYLEKWVDVKANVLYEMLEKLAKEKDMELLEKTLMEDLDNNEIFHL